MFIWVLILLSTNPKGIIVYPESFTTERQCLELKRIGEIKMPEFEFGCWRTEVK